jgi:hypothetical protein
MQPVFVCDNGIDKWANENPYEFVTSTIEHQYFM